MPAARAADANGTGSGGGWFRDHGSYLSVYLGRYQVADEPQFVGIRNKYGLGVGFSGILRAHSYLAVDFELLYVNRDYDTPVGPPLWGTIDNDTKVQTTAILVGARVFYPAEGKLNAYASAGIGYFYTRMVVSGSVFGFPGQYEDTDYSLEPYLGLGMSMTFGDWGISLDVRHFTLNGNFSAFGISDANLGGNLLLVGWKYTF